MVKMRHFVNHSIHYSQPLQHSFIQSIIFTFHYLHTIINIGLVHCTCVTEHIIKEAKSIKDLHPGCIEFCKITDDHGC